MGVSSGALSSHCGKMLMLHAGHVKSSATATLVNMGVLPCIARESLAAPLTPCRAGVIALTLLDPMLPARIPPAS
jgi:hypothetical protein